MRMCSIDSSPAVVNGVVYVGSYDKNLYALNATTGTLLWKYTTGSYIELSSPAVANGVVYFGSSDNNLYALNAGTGVLLWQYTTGGIITCSPAVANGVVYIGSFDGNLYAFDLTGGLCPRASAHQSVPTRLCCAPIGRYYRAHPPRACPTLHGKELIRREPLKSIGKSKSRVRHERTLLMCLCGFCWLKEGTLIVLPAEGGGGSGEDRQEDGSWHLPIARLR
jgi:PQQ-like domain